MRTSCTLYDHCTNNTHCAVVQTVSFVCSIWAPSYKASVFVFKENSYCSVGISRGLWRICPRKDKTFVNVVHFHKNVPFIPRFNADIWLKLPVELISKQMIIVFPIKQFLSYSGFKDSARLIGKKIYSKDNSWISLISYITMMGKQGWRQLLIW